MSAGLPGLGLSGLFVLVSAFGMPAVRRNGRHKTGLILLGVLMAAAAVASWDLLTLLIRPLSAHTRTLIINGHGVTVTTFSTGRSLPILAISFGILATLVIGAEVAAWLVRGHATPLPPPVALVTLSAVPKTSGEGLGWPPQTSSSSITWW